MSLFKKRWHAFALGAAMIPAGVWSATRLFAPVPPLKLAVSLSARELRVVENGEVVRTYGVAVGRPSHPTPTGVFRTGDIVWNPSWTPPPTGWARNKSYQPPGAAANPMRGVKIYFKAPYYYIHGTNAPGSIGEAASHGCIRMTEDDAVALAKRIEKYGSAVLSIER
jgi:lipoprotein-anchoring transpeptidase ErfK/SrfK